jgi:hypothetical protein
MMGREGCLVQMDHVTAAWLKVRQLFGAPWKNHMHTVLRCTHVRSNYHAINHTNTPKFLVLKKMVNVPA